MGSSCRWQTNEKITMIIVIGKGRYEILAIAMASMLAKSHVMIHEKIAQQIS